MQVICQNKDKEENSKRVSIINSNTYIQRISECLEREYISRYKIKRLEVFINKEFIGSTKEKAWKRR